MGTFEVIEILGLILLIAGFILIGVELVVPGFGLPGISGIVCLVLGIVICADSVEQGLTITIVVVVLLAIMLTAGLTIIKKVNPPFILDDNLNTESGFLSKQDLDYLVGKKGVASTDLRPCGKCNIEGVEFDVRTDGGYINRGTQIEIVRIREKTIIVHEVKRGINL